MTDEPITVYTCAGCSRRARGLPSYVPEGWHKVTVRIGAEHVAKSACSRSCVATILRAIAGHVVANDTLGIGPYR